MSGPDFQDFCFGYPYISKWHKVAMHTCSVQNYFRAKTLYWYSQCTSPKSALRADSWNTSVVTVICFACRYTVDRTEKVSLFSPNWCLRGQVLAAFWQRLWFHSQFTTIFGLHVCTFGSVFKLFTEYVKLNILIIFPRLLAHYFNINVIVAGSKLVIVIVVY